jgi:hypothetical protein
MKFQHELICPFDRTLRNAVMQPVEKPQLQKLGEKGFESNGETRSFIVFEKIVLIRV